MRLIAVLLVESAVATLHYSPADEKIIIINNPNKNQGKSEDSNQDNLLH